MSKILNTRLIILILMGKIFSQVVPFLDPPELVVPHTPFIEMKHLGLSGIRSIDFDLSLLSPSKRNTYISSIGLTLDEDLPVNMLFYAENIPHAKIFIKEIHSHASWGPLYIKDGLNFSPVLKGHSFIITAEFNIIPEQNSYLLLNDIILFEYKNRKQEIKLPENTFINNRDNPVILVTGFWPPTNEMIRHFSQSTELNPDGWDGENWEERGYDVISYFPQFTIPNCSNCGQGYGDLEVDYQDTSNDFWPMVESHAPVAMITFSRGFNDQSWEMEYNYVNRTNWIGDYATPIMPTPNPPDESVTSYFTRNSTLPMQEIVDAVENAGLGLNPFIDWDGDPGHFVSEFMGYHGVWYQDLNIQGDSPCFTAGHIHVGGQVDWDTAREAAEISIREMINYLDQFSQSDGDVNNDGQVNVLDVIQVVNVILGQAEFTNPQFYAADLNDDGNINIQDIILLINIILSP